MNSHKDLKVWQKSIDHVVDIYAITRLFPQDELFGIVSQMRRAAISIPSNIAEGYGRLYNKETIKFLSNVGKFLEAFLLSSIHILKSHKILSIFYNDILNFWSFGIDIR